MIFKKTRISCLVAGAMMAMSGTAFASGFALIEMSASGMGNAFAGGAAVAEDASTIFFNPAGMSRLEGNQVVAAIHAINPSAKFSGTGGVGGTDGGDAGGLAFVPNAYLSMSAKPGLKLGLGINAPFGLQTEYDSDWKGRMLGIKSKIETVNINPSAAYQVNEVLSVGVGVDYQHIKGELTSFAGATPPGTAIIKGSDNAWGYNLGILYDAGSGTRFGIAYRSAISYTMKGTAEFSPGPGPNGPIRLDIKMPDSLSFSSFHQYNEKWDVMADATWTGWGSLKSLDVLYDSGTTLSSTLENWKNTWRVSVGASHHYNEKWTSRFGVAFDQAPVSDAFRTVRVPDNDRTWLSFGGQYKTSKVSAVDFGYSHLFVKDSTINSTGIGPGPALIGTYKNSVDILSVQYSYNF